MEMAINLETIELGENENHLVFKGYVPRRDNHSMYKFDFYGADLISTFGLSEEQREELSEKLAKDFEYPPFDINEAKRIFGKAKQYHVKM